jgi:hypothetical protein
LPTFAAAVVPYNSLTEDLVRKVLLPICLVTLCLPTFVKAAPEMMDFTRLLPNDVLPLSLMHLNETTLPMVFQPPTLLVLRARAKEATQFYVQGTAKKALSLDTTNFTIEQDGDSITSTPINIKHFEKGTASVAKDDQVNGVLVFGKLVDVTKSFTVKHGKDTVKIEFSKDQVKAMAPAPAK